MYIYIYIYIYIYVGNDILNKQKLNRIERAQWIDYIELNFKLRKALIPLII